MPQEMQNRIKSKAHMEYKEGKEAFVAMYEKLSAEKYFSIERAKLAQSELMKKIEEKNDQYKAVVRENERLLRKIQDLQAPRGGG